LNIRTHHTNRLVVFFFDFFRYPAKVFGGDVMPYYSGMTLAVSAMLGHFPKSLFLLMLPQLLNFLYSLPQLFKCIPIPRHRLPRVNLKTGFLRPSKVAPDGKTKNIISNDENSTRILK
jgi:UDP-N-acetylglucosamine--dolichyl-phosphate N-acetylglucosaminephosphotransferase